MPPSPTTINCVYGVINTSGSVVDKYLPLNPVYLDFHNPSYQLIALLPAELSDQLTRYCEKVLHTARPKLPSLHLDYLEAHAVPQYQLGATSIKTQPLVYSIKAYKLTSCN